MDKAKFSFCFVTFVLCIVACTCSMDSNTWAEQNKQLSDTWCVANPSASNILLQNNIDFFCTKPGVDCSVIKPGGPCFLPNTVRDHASVVFNLYYKTGALCPSRIGNIVFTDPCKLVIKIFTPLSSMHSQSYDVVEILKHENFETQLFN
ncbi:hypothetical protein CsSME_00010516 [Camellia sinensis var. sinensis]